MWFCDGFIPCFFLVFLLLTEVTCTTPQTEFTNPAKKHVLDLAKYPKARCLDGSPGAYYFSAPSTISKKFYIFRSGGGFCYSLDDCLGRSQGWLGSSANTFWQDSIDLAGQFQAPHMAFDRNVTTNPLLWNWNHVYLIYCDGGYYSGSKDQPTIISNTEIYFNGADIQHAVLSDLAKEYGLSEATDLVIGGCSAGAVSMYANLPWIMRHPTIPKDIRVAAFACSGYFLHYENYTNFKKFAFDTQNMSHMIDETCLSEHEDDPHSCLIGEESVPHVKVPLFMWESYYDNFQLGVVYNKCASASCASLHSNRVVTALHKVWKAVPTIGAFLTGCPHHCEDSGTGDVAHIQAIDGDFPVQALAKFYETTVEKKSNGGRRIWEALNSDYPCFQCCPSDSFSHRHVLYNLE